MNPFSGETRKSTADAISVGIPNRPTGIPVEAIGADVSLDVSKAPGTIWLTIMLLSANSSERALVNPKAPIFDALTCPHPLLPLNALSPETFIILPHPSFSIPGIAALQQ